MKKSRGTAGYFRSGLPYNQFGNGTRHVVIFQGLEFENKPLTGLMLPLFADMYRFLEQEYTATIVTRKPGLPDGYTMRDMADDYAAMIREEFGGPVDVIGVSTGGSIAQRIARTHSCRTDFIRPIVCGGWARKRMKELLLMRRFFRDL